MTIFLSNLRRTVALIFFLALLTRTAFIFTQQDGFYFPDSLQYSQTAINLLTGGEFGANYNRAPAYPVFLAGIYGLSGESLLAVRLAESFLGALLGVIIAAIGRRAVGEIAGTVAGVTWAIYPMGIFIAGLVYPTNLATTFLACGVLCALSPAGQELSPKGVLSGGLFFGLAALTIPVALLTIVVVAAWVFYWGGHRRLVLTSFLLLGAAVTLGPWTARNFLVHRQMIPVQPNFQQYLPRLGTGKAHFPDDRIGAILLHFDRYAVHFGRNFLRFWELYPSRIKMSDQRYRDKLHSEDSRVVKETIYTPNRLINAISILSTGPMFLFALVGTVVMWLRKDLRRALSILWVVALSFAVGYAFFFGRIRYRIPVEPFLIILSAYGAYRAYAIIAARFNLVLQRSRRSSLVDSHGPNPGVLR